MQRASSISDEDDDDENEESTYCSISEELRDLFKVLPFFSAVSLSTLFRRFAAGSWIPSSTLPCLRERGGRKIKKLRECGFVVYWMLSVDAHYTLVTDQFHAKFNQKSKREKLRFDPLP